MRTTVAAAGSCLAALVVLLIAAPALAAAQRTFVASTGDDLTACTITAPCRSFARAITQTNPDGEIIVIDSAGYGFVIITKSVSIIAPPGIYAGVSVFSGTGITINGAGINVRLKGLSINGQGGATGVDFAQGSSLIVDGCTISGVTLGGISINAAGTVTIVDTAVLRNGIGIWVQAAATVTIARATVDLNTDTGIHVTAGASASVIHSTITNNKPGSGISVYGHASGVTRVSIDSSLIADNGSRGLLVYDNGAATVVTADLVRSTVARNGEGVGVLGTMGTASLSATQNVIADNQAIGLSSGGAGAKTRATQNTVVRNSVGFQGGGANTLYSPGNNYVRQNSFSDSFNVTVDSFL